MSTTAGRFARLLQAYRRARVWWGFVCVCVGGYVYTVWCTQALASTAADHWSDMSITAILLLHKAAPAGMLEQLHTLHCPCNFVFSAHLAVLTQARVYRGLASAWYRKYLPTYLVPVIKFKPSSPPKTPLHTKKRK